MSESPAPIPIPTPNTFNTDFFFNIGKNLTFETANKYFLSLTGGNITYLNVLGNLDCGSLTVGGLSLNIGTITGVTPGICSASKALIVDASSNISGINTLSATTLNVSGVSSTSITQITTNANYSGVMDTASIVLKQASVTNGNKIGIDFMISTNTIDNANTATCSIYHERISAYQGDLVFSTKRIAITDSTLVEALRISSTGTCSIANTSSGYQLNLGASGTGISTNALTTTSLTLGATAITATGIELNYLDLTTGAGTAEASKALVLDANKDISTIRNMSVSGIITLSASTTTLQMNVPASNTRSNFIWNTDSNNFQYELGVRGSTAGGPNNAMYFYRGGYSMCLYSNGLMTMGGLITPPSRQLEINSSTGVNLRLTYNATSNLCDFLMSSTGILTIAPSSGTTNLSASTVSSSNTTGALTLSGGIGISLTTDATSSTNGGTLTSAGGAAFAKKIFAGDNITTAGKLISTISGQGWNHNDGVNNLVSYVNNAGFGANCFFGSATASSLVLQTNNIGYITIDGAGSGLVSFTNTTDATSSSSGGCVQIAGGVGILKKLYIGSNINASGVSASTSNTTGILTLAGGIGIYNTTDATSSTNGGTLTSAGGGAFAKSVYIGGNLAVSGTISLSGSLIDLGYITAVTAGTADASKALVLDASKNISTINSITSNYVVCNTAFNSPLAAANLSNLNLNGIVTNYGVASIKGNATLNSQSFATTNSVIYMESSNANPITAEFGLSSGTGATSTNGLKLGTLSNNDFSLFTNSGIRMVIKANASIGLGSNASTADKTLCLLDGIPGITTTSFRIGNTLSSNNCMSMEWICSGGSGSGGNGLHFNPYGTSDALVINCNGYVGIGGNGLYPLDIFSYKTSTVVAPYALSESTTASYVASPNISGQNISLNCLHSALFLEKVFISSDRRLKKNIAPINLKVARQFLNVQPVVYHKREQADNDMLNFGYIAQDIMKNNIGELLCHVDNDNMKIELDGDIPGIQFNVQYDKVAPLLHVIVKEHDNIIEKLKNKINSLEDTLEDILNELREMKSNQCLDILYS